jgi:glycosyltransferase involved in cell wall biosynthesis
MAEGVKEAGYPGDHIRVIPNSCDRALFEVPASRGQSFRQRFEWLGSRPLVVYAGTLGIINGVSYFVEVASVMRQLALQVRFLVLGDGIEREQIKSLAQKRGVWEKNFFLLPPIAKQDMPDVLSAADIATSLFRTIEAMWHNSANKFFDALASRTPVAINYGGWQSNVLRESGAGLVMDPENPRAAAINLHKALSDPEWLQHAAEAASILACERFDRDQLAAQLEEVLRMAVEDAG